MALGSPPPNNFIEVVSFSPRLFPSTELCAVVAKEREERKQTEQKHKKHKKNTFSICQPKQGRVLLRVLLYKV